MEPLLGTMDRRYNRVIPACAGGMDPLTAVTQQIDLLLQQCVNEGLLDDQFLQLQMLQVRRHARARPAGRRPGRAAGRRGAPLLARAGRRF